MFAKVINTSNSLYPTAMKDLINQVLPFTLDKVTGKYTTAGQGKDLKWWFDKTDLDFTATFKVMVKSGLRPVSTSKYTLDAAMARMGGQIIEVKVCDSNYNVYPFVGAGWAWLAEWLDFNPVVNLNAPVCPAIGKPCDSPSRINLNAVVKAPVRVVEKPIPSVEDIKRKLLYLQAEEFKAFAYSKKGQYIKDHCRWSFRSTARTMLKKRIEAIWSLAGAEVVIADVYAGMTLKDWVKKFYYA